MDENILRKLAESELEYLCKRMPEALRRQALKIPVCFESVPNNALVAEGIDVETLGLFTGFDINGDGSDVLPPKILLFINNLWEISGGNLKIYRQEVRTTYLHELGHFLGLSEDEISARGLE